MSTTFNAIASKTAKSVELVQISLPALVAGEILVKVTAVALNPTDWKHRGFVAGENEGLGCDFAGVISEIFGGASDIKANETASLKVGDRVAGFVHGGRYPGTGAFAEFVKTEAVLVWKVPSNVDDEEAAAMGGVGPHTAFQALYVKHGLSFPIVPLKTPVPFLVWGGSSSVGLYAIQLLKLSGYTVVATSSPKNYDLLKSLGAEAVFNYADADTPAKIKAAYPSLGLGLDCIAENGTTALLAKSIANGGKIVTLLPVAPEASGVRNGLEIQSTLAYTLLGKAFTFPGWAHFPAEPEDKKAVQGWLQYIPSIVANGTLKSNPLWRQTGGLAGLNAGMDLLQSGKNSAQKLTFKI